MRDNIICARRLMDKAPVFGTGYWWFESTRARLMMMLFIKKVFQFYRHDCCWPYALSFFLALIIYGLDFFIVNTRYHWASLAAYGIILAYYLYIASLYHRGKVKAKDDKFSVKFLSAKIIIWGLILILLYLTKYQNK